MPRVYRLFHMKNCLIKKKINVVQTKEFVFYANTMFIPKAFVFHANAMLNEHINKLWFVMK